LFFIKIIGRRSSYIFLNKFGL